MRHGTPLGLLRLDGRIRSCLTGAHHVRPAGDEKMSNWRSRLGFGVTALLGSFVPMPALAGELQLDPSELIGVIGDGQPRTLVGETLRPRRVSRAAEQTPNELMPSGPASRHEALAPTLANLRALLHRSPVAAASVLESGAGPTSASGLLPRSSATFAMAPFSDQPGAIPQVVLDFDGGVSAYDVTVENLDGTSRLLTQLPSHVYTLEERAQIEAAIAADVGPFGIVVSQAAPADGEFSTLTFNAPLPVRLIAVQGGGFLIDGSFGDSDSIDQRNRDRSDNAVIAAHLWEFLALSDPSGQSFSRVSGLAVDAEHPLAERVSEAVIRQSANTAAHELGHLLGLRHHDGFGPPGSGLPDLGPSEGAPDPLAFIPPFEGPRSADETVLHLMSTGRTGVTPGDRASLDQFFSERSAVKIVAGQLSTPTPEAEARCSTLEPIQLAVPNPVLEGIDAGLAQLDVKLLLVSASISAADEIDDFRFHGVAGEVWTIELVSTSDPHFVEPVVSDLRLFSERPDGTRELIASNAQTFEPNDPLLLDIELPVDGTFVLEVDAPDTAFIDSDGDGAVDDPISLEANGLGALRTGDYELWLYSIAPPKGSSE
jgi:hypothetical protein